MDQHLAPGQDDNTPLDNPIARALAAIQSLTANVDPAVSSAIDAATAAALSVVNPTLPHQLGAILTDDAPLRPDPPTPAQVVITLPAEDAQALVLMARTFGPVLDTLTRLSPVVEAIGAKMAQGSGPSLLGLLTGLAGR